MHVVRCVVTTFLALSVAAWAQSPFVALGYPIPPLDPFPIAGGDFDGDGDLDLLLPEGAGGAISINDGDGRFRRGLAAPSLEAARLSGCGPHLAVTGDFDGDGALDCWVRTSSGLLPFRNDGSGRLTTAPWAAPPTSVTSFSAGGSADLDGDGDADLLLVPGGIGCTPISLGAPEVWVNDGIGNFVLAGSALPAGLLLGTTELHLADFDGDGDIDAFIPLDSPFPPPGAQGVLLWNDGAGNFTLGATLGGTLGGVGRASVGDVNGDGRPDIALAAVGSQGQVEVFINLGGQSFSPPLVRSTSGSGAPVLLDTNGDGRDELLICGDAGLDVYPISGSAIGPMQRRVTAIGDAFHQGDVDGDGDRDLILWRDSWPRVPPQLVLASPAGLRLPPAPVTPPQEADAIAFADLEGDGHLDLIAWSSFPRIYRNGGTSRFSVEPLATWNPTIGSQAGWVPLALLRIDADQDGDDDLIVLSPNDVVSGVVADSFIAINDGLVWNQGQFLGVSGRTMATGDLNGDGLPDLVVAMGLPGYSSLVLFNQGNGNFSSPVPLTSATTATAMDVALIDWDGDGDLDIAEANVAYRGGACRLFLNDGTGTFTLSSRTLSSISASTVTVGDIDGDGKMDAIFEGTLWMGTNTYQGSLVSTLSGYLPTTLFYDRMDLIDVDLDGDLDAVRSNGQWWEFVGGTFSEVRTLPDTARGGFAIGDVDLDGDIDLMGQTLSLLGNTTRQLAPGNWARPGRRASLQLFGAIGERWSLLFSPSPDRVPVPGIGTLLLQPQSLMVFASGTFQRPGHLELGALIPSQAATIGQTLYWQALIFGPTRTSFTGSIALTVQDY